MKKNPVIPYAIIAGLGLIAVIIISVIGIDQRQAIQNEEENGEEQTEQAEGGEEGGESTSADAGEEVFQTNCTSCHGQDLASGPAPDLTEIGSKYSQEEIAEIVENGTDGGMPSFPQLQGDDLDALTEWLSEHQ